MPKEIIIPRISNIFLNKLFLAFISKIEKEYTRIAITIVRTVNLKLPYRHAKASPQIIKTKVLSFWLLKI